ncbi:MAG: hypothetical protein U9R19_06855 [Bacteroidota bacterium]|nr:hypothetical protein [Bacteroidota bacterium]
MRKNKSGIIIQHYPLLLSFVVLIAGSLRYFILNDIWLDEGSSLFTALVGPGKVIGRTLAWEEQAPFYYFMLSLWLQISSNYYFARLLSLIFAMAGMFMFYKIISKHEKSKLILSLFLILFAINHFTIFAAVTIRYYAFVQFLSLSMFYVFLNSYTLEKSPVTKHRALFILLASIAVLTQYYLAFLLLAFGLTIWIRIGFSRFMKFCVDMALPVAILMGLALIIWEQFCTYSGLDATESSFAGMLEFIYVKLENSFIAFNYFPRQRSMRYLVRAFFLIILVFGFINIKKIKDEGKSIILVLFFTSLLLMALYIVIHTDFINVWHTMFFFVNALLLAFFFISVIGQKVRILFLSILILFNLLSGVFYYKPSCEMASVITHIEKKQNKELAIFIYPNLLKDVFQIQYKGSNKLIAVPQELDYNKGFKMQQWVIKDTLQLDSLFISNNNVLYPNFIVLTDTKYEYHVKVDDFRFDLLNEYLDSRFRLVSDTSICTCKIRQYSVISKQLTVN